MKFMSRYTGWILPALTMLITLGAGGSSWGATPQIAAGANHTIFLQADGTLWGAGLNLFGQLGDGSFASHSTPIRIGSDNSWTAVSAGAEHNLALKADGTLWAWGRSDSGQLGRTLGNGSPVANQSAPVQVGTGHDWVAVAAAGGSSSYALKGDGTLWAWGGNGSGQLGLGLTTQQNSPVQVPNPGSSRYLAIASGGDHALALQADGTLWAWGLNSSGQLGDGSSTQRLTPVQVLIAAAPSDNDWRAIAAGDAHSLALKADGTLWAWGGDSSGQLGLGSTAPQSAPVQVGTGRDWSGLAAGSLHTLALKKNGTLWAWGDNRSGQLGNSLTTRQSTPVQIGAPAPLGNLIALAGGAFHSLALKANGEIYAWGDNGTGQFGDGSASGSLSPVLVGSGTLGWVAGEPGNQFGVARRSNGTLWSWGDNSNGQLGDGSLTERHAPAMIGVQENWAAHSAGFSHVVALGADGTLWSWGDNSSGQLGDNTVTPSLVPEQITVTTPHSASNDWAAVAAGDFHTLALKADGTLWSWGDNSSGQLGDASNTPAGKKPNQVLTGNPGNFDSNWVAIAAGGNHSLGLQSDGTLWAWGDNTQGQLGDPAVVGNIHTPNQIVDFTPPAPGYNGNWKGIAAGLGHSLALQSDGTLWSWGSNFSGQLGNGDASLPSPADQPVPVPVLNPGTASWVALAAGDAHSLARQSDGSLWSWGRNTSGQLGIGNSDPDPFHPVPHATPVREALGGNDWTASGTGGSHSVALKAAGTLWGMGSNFSGQLGDGTTLDRNLATALLEAFLAAAPSLDFGTAAIGGGAARLPLNLDNPGNGVLFVTGITLSGSDSAFFNLEAGTCPSAASFALPAKGSCALSVVFTPSAPAGEKGALLWLDSSDPVQPQALVSLSAASVAPLLVSSSVAPAGGGTVSPQGTVLALPGSSPVFAIAPSAGFHIADVTVNGISRGAASSVTLGSISADTAIAAFFALNPHTVTLNAGSNGSISGPTSVTENDTPSYSIIPAAGFHVADVTLSGISQGALSALTLPAVHADLTIAASFAVNSYSVTLNPGLHGGITGPATATFGATPSYTIAPEPGSFITGVTVDGVSQGVVSALTLPPVAANVTIAASFGVTSFAVTGSNDARGSIAPSGTTLVPYGSSQTFSFTPNAGYHVVNVVVDGVSQGAVTSYTFNNVTGNGHSFRVVFIPDGDMDVDGSVTIADALKALQVAVGLTTASAAQLLHGDVAPLDLGGVPVPDNQITVADALVILRKSVGLVSGF